MKFRGDDIESSQAQSSKRIGGETGLLHRWPVLAGIAPFLIFLLATRQCLAQEAIASETPRVKRVLMLFSEARDLPGNAMMEQAVRTEMLRGTNQMEFFAENLDAGRFSDPNQPLLFKDYLERKYAGKHLDAVIAFMARDFSLMRDLSATVISNLPVVFVAINELPLPEELNDRRFSGIVQHFDIEGTIKLIFQLQPATRHVVVVGGVSKTDRIAMARIEAVDQTLENIEFEYWTNRPVVEIRKAVAGLSEDSVILLSTVQRDASGEMHYTSQVAQKLAASASAPVYVLSAGSIGSGVLGGNVVDFDSLGKEAGRLALRALAGDTAQTSPIVRKQGTPIFDWRVLNRWGIKPNRLPPDAVIRYRPRSIWEEHKTFILAALLIVLAQAATIAGLLVQRSRRQRAEKEIEQKRLELAHVTRISTMGQLASALAHELNQPLGAILRNAEAAELFLQQGHPDVEELRGILNDIRKDDLRAGRVIDRMRSLLKRGTLESTPLDMRELVEDTLALARQDVLARQVRLTLELGTPLPPVSGDRVHLQQVLLNLIINGMDAMKDCPAAERLLIVRAAADAAGVSVSVSDAGSGLTADASARVFEPFFTTKSSGLGMGLAISRTIIEAHGGKIRGENNSGRGAVFTYTLPALKSNGAAQIAKGFR